MTALERDELSLLETQQEGITSFLQYLKKSGYVTFSSVRRDQQNNKLLEPLWRIHYLEKRKVQGEDKYLISQLAEGILNDGIDNRLDKLRLLKKKEDDFYDAQTRQAEASIKSSEASVKSSNTSSKVAWISLGVSVVTMATVIYQATSNQNISVKELPTIELQKQQLKVIEEVLASSDTNLHHVLDSVTSELHELTTRVDSTSRYIKENKKEKTHSNNR